MLRVAKPAALAVLIAAGCGTNDTPPPPAQPDWSPRDFACQAALNIFKGACPGMPVPDQTKCSLTSEPQTTKRDAATIEALGTGEFVNFGLPGPEWFMINRQTLLANNDEALCGNLTTVARYAKATQESACTRDEITKVRRIDIEIAEATYDVDDADDLERKRRKGLERGAKVVGLTPEQAQELMNKVVFSCGDELLATSTTCTDDDIAIAIAVRNAERPFDDADPRSMQALRARHAAVRRAAKKFGIGPAQASAISDKVAQHCQEKVPF